MSDFSFDYITSHFQSVNVRMSLQLLPSGNKTFKQY